MSANLTGKAHGIQCSVQYQGFVQPVEYDSVHTGIQGLQFYNSRLPTGVQGLQLYIIIPSYNAQDCNKLHCK